MNSDCKATLHLEKKIQREEGGVEGICKFFLRITIAKNNSRRKDSEEMAECLQPPKFHTVKTGKGLDL